MQHRLILLAASYPVTVIIGPLALVVLVVVIVLVMMSRR
jgi:hypothetical protein